MTLRTGVELITLTILINKLTGVYGFLAIFTGYHLSGLQLSMYIYSIAALVLTTILSPHIRKHSPLQCLALAWFYAIDSIINACYTAAFGVAWFLVLAKHTAPFDDSDGSLTGPGGSTIGDTAGFTRPKYNVSHVDVVDGDDARGTNGLVGHPHPNGTAAAQNSGAAGGVLSSTILNGGSIASITVISALWAMRFYFIIIMMAYARVVLRQSTIAKSSSATLATDPLDSSDTAGSNFGYLENPFINMSGWAGKLGRIMVSFPRNYWLGPDANGDEAQLNAEFGRRFGSRGRRKEYTGVAERERRRRAGTGPPVPEVPQVKPVELDEMK